jgi:hypothetical protein
MIVLIQLYGFVDAIIDLIIIDVDLEYRCAEAT